MVINTAYISNNFEYLTQFLNQQNYSKLVIITDTNTQKLCLPILNNNLPQLQKSLIITISEGEKNKNINTCSYVWQQLLINNIDRNALIINLGGGVVGDLGGFCAATYKRGIDFIQIPTTLLAMVDASVGGKTGIDFLEIKNAIGSFHQPKAVFINPTFLQTLPKRQILNGFAEMIKHAFIHNETLLTHLLTINFKQINWIAEISNSVSIKNNIVTADPFEKGPRKILNFGHTIGHAIESLSLQTKKPLLHGEAIIYGMYYELLLSVQKLEFDLQNVLNYKKFMQHNYKPFILKKNDLPKIYTYLLNDKKNENNTILCTLLKKIGQPLYNQQINQYEINNIII